VVSSVKGRTLPVKTSKRCLSPRSGAFTASRCARLGSDASDKTLPFGEVRRQTYFAHGKHVPSSMVWATRSAVEFVTPSRAVLAIQRSYGPVASLGPAPLSVATAPVLLADQSSITTRETARGATAPATAAFRCFAHLRLTRRLRSFTITHRPLVQHLSVPSKIVGQAPSLGSGCLCLLHAAVC